MTLEERIKRYAEKGELTHLSLAYHDGEFHALLALASPPNGYTKAEDKDPIKALEKMFALAPVKVLPRHVQVTAAVTDPVDGGKEINEEKTGLPGEWTAP